MLILPAALSAGRLTAAPHEVIGRHAADLFTRVPPGERVAAWNAGIAAWETGGHVINLDGLANADVVESIRTGRLACFLTAARVGYLMDFGFMFPGQIDTGYSTNEEGRRRLHMDRNGYDAATLYRCTSPEVVVDDAAFVESKYRLLKLDRGCVAALCAK